MVVAVAVPAATSGLFASRHGHFSAKGVCGTLSWASNFRRETNEEQGPGIKIGVFPEAAAAARQLGGFGRGARIPGAGGCAHPGAVRQASQLSRQDIDARWLAASYSVCQNTASIALISCVRLLTVVSFVCSKISEKHDKVFVTGCLEPDTSQPRANAAFVVLARNKEIDGVIQSIKSMERHFNRWYHYPYVFLNDAEFDETFKETVRNYTSGAVEFGKVEPGTWGFPDWIDEKVAKEGIAKQGDAAVMYGGMESYHFMCRFYSG